MNFKTIFSIAVLALAAVNASPIDEVSQIKKDCQADHRGIFLLDESVGEYTCLHEPENEVNPYRTCFYTNEGNEYVKNIYCIQEGWNTIPSCSKNSGASNYVECATKIAKMLEKNGKLAYRIRKYPNHEKLIFGYDIDQKECLGHSGIVLTYKEVFQYICLEPVVNREKIKNFKDIQCAKVDGKLYCINEENTSITICNKNNKEYDHDTCKKVLKEYGTVKHLDVEAL